MKTPAMSPPRSLALEYIAPSLLIGDPRNPRHHNKTQIAAIARSIETFGFNVPIVADGDGHILAGHGRAAAALKLELDTVPVVRVDHLSPAQRQAFAIADNRLTDTSHWDEQLLGEVLRDLSLADLDFEIDAIGFSVCEIDLKIDAVTNVGEGPNADDEPVELGEGRAITAPGDLWLLGKHRLLCSNALDPASWSLLMNGAKADMVFSDPPYGLPASFISGLGKIRHRDFAMGAGEMDRDQFTAFLGDAFRQMAANMAGGALAYICMDHRHLIEMMTAGESNFSEFKTLCAWVKPSGGMGGLYRNRMELIFIWKAGRGRNRNNVALGKYGRNRTNVWEYPGIASFRHSEGGDLLASHPTCKCVKLVSDAILDVTARGEIVIDPFLGSGTTIIAAERVGRIAYGMEIDPVYCDGILRRYRNLTGEEPILSRTSQTLAELEAERSAEQE
jgi:DNA modification methylase